MSELSDGTPFQDVTIRAAEGSVTSDHPFFDGMAKPWFLPDGGEITITGELFEDLDGYRITSIYSRKGAMLFGHTGTSLTEGNND